MGLDEGFRVQPRFQFNAYGSMEFDGFAILMAGLRMKDRVLLGLTMPFDYLTLL